MKINKIALLTAVAVTVTGAAFAAPQTMFEKGQVQVDAGIFNPKYEVGNNGKSEDKVNFAGGLTYALSNKTALQYNYTGLKTESESVRTNPFHSKGHMHEVNLVQSLNKYLAVYGGYANVRSDLLIDGSETNDKVKNNIAQAGFIAKAPIGSRFEVYGKAGLGTKRTTTWEAGAAFKATKDLDLNVGYKFINTAAKDKGDSWDGGDLVNNDINMTFKGLTAGLSYRFGGSTPKVAPTPVPAPVYTPAPVVRPAAPVVEKHIPNDYYVQSIHFGFDEATPLPTQQENLDLFVNTAKAYPNNTFKLVGHTDNIGNYEYNQALSEARVNNVLNYAIAQGVPAGQVKTLFKGYEAPASDNSTDQGRADNRRVDVYINR